MRRKRPPISFRTARRGNGRALAALLACFIAGVLTDWSLRSYGPPLPAGWHARSATSASATDTPDGSVEGLSWERERQDEKHETSGTSGLDPQAVPKGKLRLPIDGVDVEALKGGFAERRGDRPHEAIDIMAPRNTPIHAVQDGEIAKLFFSKAGGNTVYQYDPTGRYCYYYAHLQRYAPGLHDGQVVKQGEVIGYVGTSGNAPPNAPHLHFAVFEITSAKRWWEGRSLDPYLLFRESLAH
jgi:peptidoglycan LD-endopeptidase LytH